jgi:hypothetical protein
MNQLPAYSHFQQTLLSNTTHYSSMVFVNMTSAVHLTLGAGIKFPVKCAKLLNL